MVDDVFSDRFSLLIQCPNAVRGAGGSSTGAYLPNPVHARNPRALSMLEFLGKLMGLSLRTKACLPFAFPSLVWRAVAGGAPAGHADLEDMDTLFARYLTAVASASSSDDGDGGVDALSGEAKPPISSEADFARAFPDARWVAPNAEGEEVEVVPGGAHRRVRLADRLAFVEAATAFRLHEFDPQLAAIRRGLGTIVPLRAMSLFSAAEVEVLVSGRPDIDVDTLRRHTKYEGGYGPSHPVVQRFWRVLAAMTPEERAGYVSGG